MNIMIDTKYPLVFIFEHDSKFTNKPCLRFLAYSVDEIIDDKISSQNCELKSLAWHSG